MRYKEYTIKVTLAENGFIINGLKEVDFRGDEVWTNPRVTSESPTRVGQTVKNTIAELEKLMDIRSLMKEEL